MKYNPIRKALQVQTSTGNLVDLEVAHFQILPEVRLFSQETQTSRRARASSTNPTRFYPPKSEQRASFSLTLTKHHSCDLRRRGPNTGTNVDISSEVLEISHQALTKTRVSDGCFHEPGEQHLIKIASFPDCEFLPFPVEG